MTEIKPFKGITYNAAKAPDVSRVIAPPYDVINPEAQDGYYLRDEHNIVRIILGKSFPSDSETENRYSRAAQFLTEWLEEGVLNEDGEPCLYIYEQQFVHKKKKYSRKGFLGLLRFDAEGGIKVHENTFPKPKEDRLCLMRATRANTEPIFTVYSGDAVSIPDEEPVMRAKDDAGVMHLLWRVQDQKEIRDFCDSMSDKNIYIADGHHRYETAKNYAAELNIDPKSSDPRNYILTYFVEEQDPGMLVLPIHRMLNITPEDVELIVKNAKKYFLTVEIDSFTKIEKAVGHVFGFMNKKDGKLYMLKLRDVTAMKKLMVEKGRQSLADLDVSILHTLLLDDILEKYKDRAKEDVISFTHDEKEAMAAVKRGRANCAFLLNPAKVSQIMKIADAGGRMPQKSTFFYPKPYSGLVMRRM